MAFLEEKKKNSYYEVQQLELSGKVGCQRASLNFPEKQQSWKNSTFCDAPFLKI